MGDDMSRCGGCTLCCDLLKVEIFGKSANTVCKHCVAGQGCEIWEQRPPVCRRYVCLWYANPKFPGGLRPDRCGALFEPVRDEKVVIVNVNPARPNVWRESDSMVSKLIDRFLCEKTSVVVIIGTEKHFLLAEGVMENDVWAAITRGAKQLNLV